MNIFSTLFNKKIIIGIHGLSNKPEKKLQEEWWIKSIKEGFLNIGHPETSFVFKSVYWADLLYEKPLDHNENNPKDPLYLEDPYMPGDPAEYKEFKPNKIKRKLLDAIDKKIDKIFLEDHKFINFDKIADLFIQNLYKDLDFYYYKQCEVPKFKGWPAGEAIRSRLEKVLKKYKNKQILLIGHSMGSIISFDVLKSASSDVKVHSLITIGSPLGMSVIVKKMLINAGKDYNKEKRIESPESIKYKWYNFSDLNDSVALVYKLSEDYSDNSHGVGPDDIIIHNNYINNGRRDFHKLYGYLRAPEVANVIYEFCTSGKTGFAAGLKHFISSVILKK